MARILVVGSGGREHAIAWRLHDEGHALHVAPGNAGMHEDAELHAVAVHDHAGIVALAQQRAVDLVVVGPEQPLVDGLADRLRAAGLPTVGPSARAAELEASKAAAKAFMHTHAIPTARAVAVHDVATGLAALRTFARPPVVKADGLAAGKGVRVCETFDEAEAALRDCLEHDVFGAAGQAVVLEERLFGQEVSLFVLTDGHAAAVFEPAQDHKRIGDGDVGLNTGGMGAYAPAPVYTPAVHEEAMRTIVRPTLAGLRSEGRPFVGILFVGLMIGDDGHPRVIEYNCRFGDPEAEAILFGLDAPLYPALLGAATGTLTEGLLTGRPAATVVLAASGYPGPVRTGDRIEGLDRAAAIPDLRVFHAGTRRTALDGAFETAGGRVLAVTARAASLPHAIARAYEGVACLHFEGMQVRRDVGHRALG